MDMGRNQAKELLANPELTYQAIAGKLGVTRQYIGLIAKEENLIHPRKPGNYAICEQCGIVFPRNPSKIGKRNYCSLKCKNIGLRNGDWKTCIACGEKIYRRTAIIKRANTGIFFHGKCRSKVAHLFAIWR